MNSTIQRHLSELGQIVIPIEYRKNLAWIEKDMIDITLDESNQCIILKKAISTCYICQSQNNLTQIKGKHICEECKQELAKALIGTIIY